MEVIDLSNYYRKQDSELIDCIIVDIDGTIAQMVERSPYEYDKVDTDNLIEPVLNVIELLQAGYTYYRENFKVFIVSGRDDICEEATRKWLDEHMIDYNGLYMRETGDIRRDSVVKREIYEKHIENEYNVVAVFDDRNQVVDMWRKELKLPTFQVWCGNF